MKKSCSNFVCNFQASSELENVYLIRCFCGRYLRRTYEHVQKKVKHLSLVVLTGFLVFCALIVYVVYDWSSYESPYHCEINEVKSIQIIQLNEYVEDEYQFEYEVLCSIAVPADFVAQLNAIEQSQNKYGPHYMHISYIAVRIEYDNGNIDIIHHDAQVFYRDSKKHSGHRFFDKKQFFT